MGRQAAHPSRKPPAEKSTPPSSQRTQDHGQHPKSEGWSSKRKGNAKCSLSSWIKVYPFPAQPTKPSVKTIRGARGRGWGDRQHTHPAIHNTQPEYYYKKNTQWLGGDVKKRPPKTIKPTHAPAAANRSRFPRPASSAHAAATSAHSPRAYPPSHPVCCHCRSHPHPHNDPARQTFS